jgi:hypothetical protein
MKLKINPQTTKHMPIFGCPVWVLWFYCSQNLKLFGFAICRFWVYLMKGYSRNASCALNLIYTFLAHLAFRPCELLSSLFVRRPSVNISHFNLLLRNHWANCNQALVEWSLDGPFPKLCPTKMAAKLKIEKRGDEILIVHCCFSISQNELKF